MQSRHTVVMLPSDIVFVNPQDFSSTDATVVPLEMSTSSTFDYCPQQLQREERRTIEEIPESCTLGADPASQILLWV